MRSTEVEKMQRQLTLLPKASADATGLEFASAGRWKIAAEFAAAFEHYEQGNRLARAAFDYNPKATTAFVQRFKATFTSRYFAERADWGQSAGDPIFIVGLPRSGSTLLEQILASHSSVEGTRELAYLPTIARELAGPPETAARYPENLTALGKAQVEALAARYLASAHKHRPAGRPRFRRQDARQLRQPRPHPPDVPTCGRHRYAGVIPWRPASPATNNFSIRA